MIELSKSLPRPARPRVSALALTILSVLASRTAAAQQSVATISMERVAVLRGGGDGAFLKLGSPLVRDSRGRFYAAQLTDPGKIAVFDRQGRFLRTIGRRGGGPGEFVNVRRLFVSPGDSLFAVDASERVSVIGPDHRFVRSFRAPGTIHDSSFPPGGRLVLSIASPPDVPALMVTNRNGTRLGILGSRSDDMRDRPRLVASADAGRVWAAFSNRYQLDLLEPSGRTVRTLRRRLPWFSPERPERAGRRREGSVQDLTYDAQSGSLRVLLFRENPGFRPRAPVPGRRPAGEARAMRLDAAQALTRYDIAIEFLDPRTGRAVARANMGERLVAGFLSPTEVYAFREGADGEIVIDVWRLGISRTQPRRGHP